MIIVLVVMTGCSARDDSIILSQEQTQLLDNKYTKSTEALKITYNSDGLEVVGYLVKPKEIDEPLPLLIYNRGGNHELGKITQDTLSEYFSYWANKGFVIIGSQYRGNDGGEGEDEFGGSDVNDVLNLVKVAEELPYVNTEKKVMLGRSRGGMMTYLAIKKGIDIQAAAVVSGVTDLFAAYDRRGESMQDLLEEMVGNPTEDKGKYLARSAIHWADEIDVPIIILHGVLDWRVPVGQAQTLSKKLKQYDKTYKYIEYPLGDHDLERYFEEYNSEIDKWFKEHLKD